MSSSRRHTRRLGRSASLALSSLLVVAVPTIAFAAPIDVSSYELNFGADDGDEQTFVIGNGAEAGFTYTYHDVHINDVTIDAVVTILDVDNLDSDDNEDNGANLKLDQFDDASSSGREIDLAFDVFGDSTPDLEDAETGFVDFRVDFFDGDSGEPLSLDGLVVGVTDLDDRQFVQFYGARTYRVSPFTRLEITDESDGIVRFTEVNGYDADAGTDGDVPEYYWAEVEFGALSFLVLRAGANQSGSVGLDFLFEALSWPAVPDATPLMKEDPWELTYDLNGADGIAPDSQFTDPEDPDFWTRITIDDSTMDSEYGSCEFTGWNTRSDGRGVHYDDGDEIYLSDDITLYADWDCPSSGEANSSTTCDSTGIFLTVTGGVADRTSSSPIVYGSCGLSGGAPYSLTVEPMGSVGAKRLLGSGAIPSSGALERTTHLPVLAAGNYKVVLTSRNAASQVLTLTNHVSVSGDQKYGSISAESLQPHLK